MLNILALIVFFILLFALIYVFGEYIAWIYQDETKSKSKLPKKLKFFKKLDRPFKLIEEKIFSFLNIDQDKEMNWKQYLFSLLIFNGILFVFLFLVFKFQNILPLNPPQFRWYELGPGFPYCKYLY